MKKYNEEILNLAFKKYKPGTTVKSPMTGKIFKVENVTGTWHKEYIKGFDGRHFFDVVWYNGVFAEVV